MSRERERRLARDQLAALWGRKHPVVDLLVGIIEKPPVRMRAGRLFRCGYMEEMLPPLEHAADLARKLSAALGALDGDTYPADAPPEIVAGLDRGGVVTSALIAALDFRIDYIRRLLATGNYPKKPRGRPGKDDDGKFGIIRVLSETLAPYGEKLKLTNCGRFADSYRIMCVAFGHKEPQDTIRDFRAYRKSIC